MANALYCRGLLDRDAPRMLTAAGRYDDAGRPLFRAKALEAAAGYLVDAGDRTRARAAFTTAVEIYTSLGAAPRNRAPAQSVTEPQKPGRLRLTRQTPAGSDGNHVNGLLLIE